MTIEIFLSIAVLFFLSVVCHEYAHGWVAYRLGDPTAKEQGRLTLNPIKHVDPVGTVVLPTALVLMGSPVILGWAKPVPVNFFRLRNPKRDMLWVGFAGPATNFALAFIFSRMLGFSLPPQGIYIFEMAVVINLVLAFFNLIPIPPLDGSRIVMSLLPHKLLRPYAKIEKFGIAIVFLLLYLGLLRHAIWPMVSVIAVFLGVRM